jgi:hypothetical protein
MLQQAALTTHCEPKELIVHHSGDVFAVVGRDPTVS